MWIRVFKSLDVLLLVPLLGLMTISLMSIHSATVSEVSTGLSAIAKTQMIYAMLSLAAALIISRISLTTIQRLSPLVYVGLGGTLLWVLFFSPEIAGSRRWLFFWGYRFQPSEFMKIALILFLAKSMQAIQPFERVGLQRILGPLLLISVPSCLILLEPDLGTAGVVATIGVLIVLLCNIEKRLLLGAVVLGVISLPAAYQFGLKPYQRARVIAFLNPQKDPLGSGYNAIQSMIAIGSGRLAGKGYLKGTQSHLDFIPEQQTDFIFSAFAEEWGFLGSLLVLILYACIFIRIYTLAASGPNAFASIFCLGYAIALALQVGVNIAMVSGLLPIVGVALPFMSYGGSSLLANWTAIGICLGIKRQQRLFEVNEMI